MPGVALVAPEVGRTSDGMELRVHSPWYRSLPLSSIDVALELDGAEVEPERIRFCVNDRDYALEELRERFEEFWFVLDPARLRVRAVEPGDHELALRLGLRIPYLFDEETGEVLVIHPSTRRVVTVPEQSV